MAERTVNVTINYKVNTVEVQKAAAASQAAQKATDELRKSTEQYGKATAAAHKQAGDAAKKAQADTSSLTREFSSLYNSVKLFLTAGVVKELIDISLNMAKLSGQVEGVNRAFMRIPNATLLLNDLRKATHGTVTDLDLMQKTLMAQNFKIPLQKLGTLLEFAATKAQQTGQEVNHLVNYIVSGIGYRSIRRLDDLGFTANRMKEALHGVSLQAASMGQVMNAVTTLMDEDLKKTGGFVETAETDVKRLSTAIYDLNVEVANKATSRGLIQFFTEVVNKTRQAIKAQFTYLDALLLIVDPKLLLVRRLALAKEVELQEQITAEAVEQAAAFQKKNDSAKEADKLLNTDKELYNLAQSIQLNKQAQMDARMRINTLKEELAVLSEKNKSMIGLQMNAGPTYQLIKSKEAQMAVIEAENAEREKSNKILAEQIAILVDYRAFVDLANDSDKESLGIIGRKKAEIEALEDQIKASNKIGDLGESGTLVKALIKAQKELAILEGAEIEFHKTLAKLSDDEMEIARNVLKDKAEQRKRDLKNEEENAKRSAKLQEYFAKVRLEKEQEAEEESYRIAEDAADQKRQIQQEISDAIIGTLDTVIANSFDSADEEIAILNDKYSKQVALAGDNQRAKDELQIKFDKQRELLEKKRSAQEKKKALVSIAMDTAVNAVKLFGQTVPPGLLSALAVAFGLGQAAIVSRQKFAKGVINLQGPGTETSDSIPSALSRGESVMTAKETRESFGLLNDIRHNKINDRIMKSIDFSGGRTIQTLNDQRIVSELKSIRKGQYKLDEQAGLLYRIYTDENGNRQKIRSKSI